MSSRHLNPRNLRGESERFERPGTAKEAAILQAATRLFGEQGRVARTADIARAAGVTERTLFRYFPSKDRLYRRVMFPALLAATMPRELTETAKLFAARSESFRDWHRRVLKLRTDAARAAAPQFRLMLAALMSDEALRGKVIGIWKKNLWRHAVRTVQHYQRRKELRTDVSAEHIARAIISLNLGYIVARALLAPQADWDDDAEIAASVELLVRGAGRV